MNEPTAKSYARETAIATSILAGIALLAALFLGRVVFMPIVMALTFATIFRPGIRLLDRVRVPPVVAAPILVLLAIAIVAFAGSLLASSVRSFAQEVPTAVRAAKEKLAELPAPLNSLGDAIPEMGAAPRSGADSAKGVSDSTAKPPGDTAKKSASAKNSMPSMGPFVARVFGTAAELITDFLQTALLLVFLLAGSNSWRQKLLRGRGHPLAKALVEIGDEAQSCVSRYIAMTALINVGQGVLVGLAAWGLGLKTPAIWGVLTFFAEFLPYLGGLAMVALLLLVGLASSQGFGHAMLGPLAYLLITTLQNNIVSPIVYGRGLELNPAAILVSVILWFFLWGVPGAFLAVPILAIMKIVCERNPEKLGGVAALIAG